jgi:glycolate oxidase FAD binding subunit
VAIESLRREAPASGHEAAFAMKAAASAERAVRIAGAGTKPWGNPGARPEVELSTEGLCEVVEHNEGDFTAVLESGVTLAEAQRTFAGAGQMLALDPPLGEGDSATVGGVFATADAGPLRHRYGAPRDLIVGASLALADGSVARSGGKVIKNVAGYDLAKLFTGAYGTLGLIAQVSVRLHPLPDATATAVAETDDIEALGVAASTLSHSPLETECLDLRWSDGRGAVLARFGAAAAQEQATSAMNQLVEARVDVATEFVEDDASLWEEQRRRQRSSNGVVVKVSARQTGLRDVLRAAERAGASVVGRAAHALCWLTLPDDEPEPLAATIEELRRTLEPYPCVVLDAPEALRSAVDVWGESEGARLTLSRRLKARFDPEGVCNPGVFVGGI